MSLSLHCVVNVWFFVSQCELFVNESFCFSYQRIRSAEWLTDWVNEWICDFSLRASSAMDGGHDRNKIWNKSSLGIEDNAHMSNTHIARACAEKAHDTTPDNEKCNWHDVGAGCIDRTCIVVTAQCNQPEAFCDSRWSSVRHVTWKNNLRCPIALIQRHVPGEHEYKWHRTMHLRFYNFLSWSEELYTVQCKWPDDVIVAESNPVGFDSPYQIDSPMESIQIDYSQLHWQHDFSAPVISVGRCCVLIMCSRWRPTCTVLCQWTVITWCWWVVLESRQTPLCSCMSMCTLAIGGLTSLLWTPVS